MEGASYSVKKNRIQRGFYPGFSLEEDGTLTAVPEVPMHALYLKAIDSAVSDSGWGRLSIKGTFSENLAYYTYVLALNEDSFYRNGNPVRIEDFLCDEQETDAIKKEFLRRAGAARFVNKKDMLLYTLHGRYLYLVMEVIGEGDCSISELRVDLQGDNFMNTFPEIYRERNGFFHRYMSVFSSIYNDFEGDIGKLPGLLDLDSCPAELLPVYGRWLGIDVGNDFLEERILRPLVKEAYQLNRMKGTKAALERVAKIVLDEDVLVVERNAVEDYISREQLEEFEKLYGNSIYDVTVLVKHKITEAEKSKLLFLLNQFKPIRTRLHIIVLKQTGTLDAYSYLDMNAQLQERQSAVLDENQELDGAIRLK